MRQKRVVLAALAACAAEFMFGLYAKGAIRTWSATTSSADSNFSDAANWGGTAPVSGTDSVGFNTITNANLTPTNDITGLTLLSATGQTGMTFAGTKAFTLSGNDTTISSTSSTSYAIINSSSVLQTINNNLIFAGSQTRLVSSQDANGTIFNGNLTNLTNGTFQIECTTGTATVNGNVASGTGGTFSLGNAFNNTNGTVLLNGNITGTSSFTIGLGKVIVAHATDITGAVTIGVSSHAGVDNCALTLANVGALQSASSFSLLRNGTGGSTGTISLLATATGIDRAQAITIYAQGNAGSTVIIGGATGLGSAGTARFGGNITYGGATQANNTVSRALQLQSSEGTVTFGGTITEAFAAQTGVLSVNKIGAGTAILTGNNTYHGVTTVSGGTLLINNTAGSGTSSGAVTVNADAILGGTGTIAGTLGLSGSSGHLALLNPGGSSHAETLTVNSAVIFGDNSGLSINLSGSTSNELVVNGDLNLSSLLDNLTFTGTADGTTHYVIAAYTGTLTGTFNTVSNLPSGYTVDYNSGQIVLAPEPASFAAVGALQLSALSLRRRRRKFAVFPPRPKTA